MHRLLLLRHAKSSWDDPTVSDHDRPLTRRGRSAADALGEHLRSAGPLPDLVVSSTSVRTRETVARLGLGEVPVRYAASLYGAGEQALLEAVKALPEDAGTVLLVGHNPGMELLADMLCGPDDSEDARRLRVKFPTAALAAFELTGRWVDLGPGSARLVGYRTPRDH